MSKQVEIKTKENDFPIMEFLEKIEDESKKKDSIVLYNIILQHTKEEGKLWGDSIIGFIKYMASYQSNRSVEWFKVGFSPRKNYISLYLNFILYDENNIELAQKLGKVKIGRGCINFKKLSDLDKGVLNQLIGIALKANKV
ncbi:MAG: DUF1801 domain-containing protein [Bacteroidales bacterium]|jgi:hypothetical protein